MHIKIDIATAYVASALLLIVLTAMTILIYRTIRPSPVLKTWIQSISCYITIPIGASVQAVYPLAGSVIINTCVSLHLFYAYKLSFEWNGKPFKKKIPAIIAAAYITLFTVLAYAEVSYKLRVLLVSVIIASGYALTAFFINRKHHISNFDTASHLYGSGIMIRIAFLLYSAVYFARAVFIINKDAGAVDFSYPPFLVIIIIPVINLMISILILHKSIAASISDFKSIRESFLEAEGSRIQSKLLANLNHELNTPLGNALLAGDFLKMQEDIPPPLRSGIECINNALDEMKRITSDRNQFWGTENTPLNSRFLCELIERLIKRSITGTGLTLKFTYDEKQIFPDSRALIIVCLYASDLFFAGQTDPASPFSLDIALNHDSDTDLVTLEISDNNPSFITQSSDCIPYTGSNRNQDSINENIWPKILYLKHLITKKFSGTVEISETEEGSSIITMTYKPVR